MGTGFPAISHSQSGSSSDVRTVIPPTFTSSTGAPLWVSGSGSLAGISGPGPDFRHLGQLAADYSAGALVGLADWAGCHPPGQAIHARGGMFYILMSIFALLVQASGQSDKGWRSSITDTLTDTRWGRYLGIADRLRGPGHSGFADCRLVATAATNPDRDRTPDPQRAPALATRDGFHASAQPFRAQKRLPSITCTWPRSAFGFGWPCCSSPSRPRAISCPVAGGSCWPAPCPVFPGWRSPACLSSG